MSNRLFTANLRVNISTEEAVVIQDYARARGDKGEIGHLLSAVAQEAVEAHIARATMYLDMRKKES